jgi:3-oxoadipate enol-lactonase
MAVRTAPAAAIHRPVLSVLGSETQPLWVEEFLRSTLPQVDECTMDGAGHLLHVQRPEPVARGMAELLDRYPIGGDGLEALERPSRSPGTATVPG